MMKRTFTYVYVYIMYIIPNGVLHLYIYRKIYLLLTSFNHLYYRRIICRYQHIGKYLTIVRTYTYNIQYVSIDSNHISKYFIFAT